MGFWDWITGGPARRNTYENDRRERLKAEDIRRKKEGQRQTRSSRGGALHRETVVENDTFHLVPVFGIGDYPMPIDDPLQDSEPLDQERHGVMGTRTHDGFKTGGGFGGESNSFKTGGFMEDAPRSEGHGGVIGGDFGRHDHHDHGSSSSSSDSSSSYDSGSSSDSGSSGDSGGGGGD